STIIAAGYAALAAMLTRSILGGVLVGFIATVVEGLLAVALVLIAFFLKFPSILYTYRFTPLYNLLNVAEWLNNDRALAMELQYNDVDRITLSDSLLFSLTVLAVWVIGLIALNVYLFRRQDITS
ncbi:MAG: hypothetical protein JW910_22225, partial [Anaerolineae bacterium]|nr:hypothetical protein [Anaerolineae bacterium]